MKKSKSPFILSLIICIGLVTTVISQNQKYSSRSYKPKTNSSSNKSQGLKYEVPISSSVLSSRSLATAGGRDAEDLDQAADTSMDSTSSWDTGYRDTKSSSSSSSNSLPSVAPRWPRYSAESKYSSGSGALGGYSSTYPYASYSNPQSYYANPLLETYPYYDMSRAARELASRALPVPHSMAMAASSMYGGISPTELERDPYEDMLMAAGHHHHDHYDDHGHDHGHGYGWMKKMKEHVKHIVIKKENNNAFGLLGLLGVLTLLSNVLRLLTTTTTTTTTVAAGRRKRRSAVEFVEEVPESKESRIQRIFLEVLPLLAPVAHAINKQIPIDCTLQGVCLTNQILVKEYGHPGRASGDRITLAVVQLFENGKDEGNYKKMIIEAGYKGRSKKDCVQVYPKCKALQSHRPHQLPFVIGIDDVPKLLARVREVAANTPLQL